MSRWPKTSFNLAWRMRYVPALYKIFDEILVGLRMLEPYTAR